MTILPKVYILILNYNGWEDTIECLESVLRLDYSNFQVVVVDNNSPNDSLSYIKMWADGKLDMWNGNHNPLQYIFASPLSRPLKYDYYEHDQIGIHSTEKLIIIQAGKNDGFAAGNNAFLKFILEKDAYVWLLNPDMVAEKDSLKSLVNRALQEGTETVLGTIIMDYLQPDKILIYGGSKLNAYSGTITFIKDEKHKDLIDYIHGGSFFTHMKNFKKIGLLPEEYFLYGEETDWCYRAQKQGIRLAVCASAICYDKISTSIGKGFLAEYYYTLNSLKFYKKYNRKYIPFIVFSNGLRIIKRLLFFQNDRVKAIAKATWHFAILKSR
jgi:GT2 family glycosyltransferase